MPYQSHPQSDWSIFNATQWLYWLGATLVAAITTMVFLYSTFQTKSDASENKVDLERRLERIESKIDTLMSKR